MEQGKSTALSTRLAAMLAALVAIGPFGIDTYLPALPQMASFYGTTTASVQISISLFFMGFALGQILGGPMSDRVGRKPVAIVGLTVFTLASLAIVFTESVEQLYMFRFIQALGGGATTVISSATIRDRYKGNDVAKMLSLVSMIMLMAPMLAPGIGALSLNFFEWQSIFYILAIYGGLLLIMVIFLLPETNDNPVREGKLVSGIAKNYWEVLSNGKAMGFVLCTGFSLASLFTFLTASSFLYIEYFDLSPNIYPFTFGSNVVVYMLFNRFNVRLLNKHKPEKLIPIGIAIQLSAMVILNVHLHFFEPSLYVVYPMILASISAIGFIAANATSCTLRYFPNSSGTANAVVGTLNFGMGGVMGFLMSLVQTGNLIPMATTMITASVLSLVFFGMGMKLRALESQPDGATAANL
ncbi:Bcr/CflA family drug resistance efflux transporter [Endozoicomonas sp. OPT23]|uniref:Bcr/CflA family multidrug efflux MFS transporter n=1 Tax=Endozoicomonas sp. OPT23 TaxID=2072845 RepID=UPI00129A3B01|nr:Bcr/CflA family multidrug efflux MFS transporter [Endozoicomonas sp. OPT23]MRI33557.1 Bcr/CflA family drug resistance efflux transporter [Endozoicomonas sp. OPT23]